MNNNEILNPLEGQRVGEFIYPFYRFSAIIPNQIGGDIFVWLYLSLVVFVNETKNFSKENYNEEVKLEAQKLIIDKFSNIVDYQTLEKIVNNAEKDFIISERIKEDTFFFLDTFENLFAETCETRMVYQDAITGEILPFFGDTSNIEDSIISTDADENKKFARSKLKDPSSRSIKKAYEQYMKLKKFNSVSLYADVELVDDFYDEDEQTFLDSSVEGVFFEEKKEIKSLKQMDVIPIQDTKVEINLLVPIYIKDNQLSARSPFGKITDEWFAKCMLKGRNISEDMDKKLKAMEKQYCIEERKIESYIESNHRDFASTLKYCQTIYRLIDSLADNKIRKYVVKIDDSFRGGDSSVFFNNIGLLLEAVISKIQYSGKTTAIERTQTNFNSFCNQIDNRCRHTSVNYRLLQSKHIFDNWKKKDVKRDGTEFNYFKADITDIVMRTNLINSPIIYDSFLENLFYLYNLRNKYGSHHNSGDDNLVLNEEKLNILTKVLRVLIELI